LDKEVGKGRQEWELACKKVKMKPQKLETPMKMQFASKVLFFQKTLEDVIAINLCYS